MWGGSIPFLLMCREYRRCLVAWLSRKTAGSDYVDLAALDSREIVDDPAEGATKADLWQHLKGVWQSGHSP